MDPAIDGKSEDRLAHRELVISPGPQDQHALVAYWGKPLGNWAVSRRPPDSRQH
jgi:hypothetical protein